MMLSMSCLEVENEKNKETFIWPFVCNDGNTCYVVDNLSNFASIITVGKEIVDMCLDSISKVAALVSEVSLSQMLLEVELALALLLFSLGSSLLTME
jgi:hypothetical protein